MNRENGQSKNNRTFWKRVEKLGNRIITRLAFHILEITLVTNNPNRLWSTQARRFQGANIKCQPDAYIVWKGIKIS